MNKSKALRIGGFTLAVGLTASLVGFAAHGTGAYFSAAKDGNMNVSTGNVKVETTTTSLDFTNLLPNDFKTQKINFEADGTGPEDIYLAFDNVSNPTNGDGALNAYANQPDGGPNPLGRYGHLEVTGPQGTFDSYNLSTDPAAPHPGYTVHNSGPKGTNQDCYTSATTGLGGSSQQAADTNNADPNSYVPFCPAPQYILLAKGVTSANGYLTGSITFGFTKILKGNAAQNSPTTAIPFRIVAEQAGVSPYDVNTTNGN